MGSEAHDWRATAASALDWWREAGVDVLVEDTARDWLAMPAPVMAAPPIAPAAVADALPREMAAFAAWRSGADAPDAGWRGVAIAACGPATAELMVLTDCPDRDDEGEGALLSGAAGRLFDRMLAALGLTRAEVHLAAVCVRRPVAGKVPAELEERLHAVARHHVALVAPRRLLLLGNGASRAILNADTARARDGLRRFNHAGAEVEVVATHHPRLLLDQPARKADAWKDLQWLIGATR